MKAKMLLTILAIALILVGCGAPTEELVDGVKPMDNLESNNVANQPTSPAAATPSAVKFEESPCPFTVSSNAIKDVKCGFVVVPEDYNNPASPTIRLAVVIIKSRSSTRLPDPVILLSGGPGEKTVTSALGVAALLEPVYGERDLILFDQRGVGLSQPALECPEYLPTLYDLLDEQNPDVKLQALFESVMTCHDRLVNEGHNLSAYNNVQNAADVNAIRIALGYDKINLLGGSYGSLLAQAVMRDYPHGIRSVTLFSVVPLEKSLVVDVYTSAPQALMRLLDTCTLDQSCNTAYPNLKEVLFKTVDRLNANPVPVTLTHPLNGSNYKALLTGDAVIGNLLVLLYQSELIPVVPRVTYDVYNGDYELMIQLLNRNLLLYEAVSRGMNHSVVCADQLINRTPQEILDNRVALPPQLAGRVSPEAETKYGSFAICQSWQVKQLDPSVKQPLVSDIPTLVLTGEFDQVTPSEYGQLVASHLHNSYYFNLKGLGHNIISSECARQVAGTFFQDPTTAPDAACIANLPGITFDVPAKAVALTLKPYSDAKRGFSGLIPEGWKNLQESNLMRLNNALDPAYFVLEAKPGNAADLFEDLIGQLKQEPRPAPIERTKLGNFTWDFYTFERRGNPVDLAIAEDGEKAYFVFLVSPRNEHDVLYNQLFVPAVKAMASLP